MEKKYKYIVDGNTVREVVYEVPERKKKIEEPERIPKETPKRSVETVKHKEQSMSLGMISLLAVSVIISVVCCINYLAAQSDMTKIKDNVAALEAEIDNLSAINDAVEYEIDSYIDVEYIMSVATEQLGMVMVREDQIVNFESTRNEYMEQYGDVPEK